jgi:hypothetical protein
VIFSEFLNLDIASVLIVYLNLIIPSHFYSITHVIFFFSSYFFVLWESIFLYFPFFYFLFIDHEGGDTDDQPRGGSDQRFGDSTRKRGGLDQTLHI